MSTISAPKPTRLQSTSVALAGELEAIPRAHIEVPAKVKAALVIATTVAFAILGTGFLPLAWVPVVTILVYVLAGFAGLAAPPPAFLAGKPVLGVSVATTLGTLVPMLDQLSKVVPEEGWPHLAITAGGALLAYLTGKAWPSAPKP